MIRRISLPALLFLSISAVAAPLKIGWATSDVSTDQPVHLQGVTRTRFSKGLRFPITVTALVIDNGEDCVVFNSWDTSCVFGDMALRVRDGVAKRIPGLPVEKIVFNATHTHTGPSTWSGYTDPVSTAYRDMFAGKVIDTIVRAWNDRQPGKIAYGYDFAVTAFSRRPVYMDDLRKRPTKTGGRQTPGFSPDIHAKLHGNSFDPMFSHMEAAPDPFVNFLFTYDMNDKLTGAIFNVAFTSQVSQPDMMLNSDCWHDIRREMKKEFGDGIYVLPQVAAAGDMTYKIPYYYKATERKHRLRFGRPEKFPGEFERVRCTEQLMAAFHRTIKWASRDLYGDLPIRHINTTLHLKRFYATEERMQEAKENLVKLQELKKKAAKLSPEKRKARMKTIQRAEANCRRVLKLNDEIKKKPTWAMEFHVLRIGEIAFVSERYELYTDFGQRIQARSPFTQTFTIQLSAGLPDLPTGVAGYLPTARSLPNGGYQSHPINNANAPSPEGGQQMVDEAVRLLYELKKDDK